MTHFFILSLTKNKYYFYLLHDRASSIHLPSPLLSMMAKLLLEFCLVFCNNHSKQEGTGNKWHFMFFQRLKASQLNPTIGTLKFITQLTSEISSFQHVTLLNNFRNGQRKLIKL